MAVFSFICITSVVYVIFNGGMVSSATMNSEPVENQSPTTCNTCCQNGMHGIPGQHGLPGSKGDPGVKGQKGQSGEAVATSGPPGPKGSMGWPGKSGPKGPQGPAGPEGPRGRVGPKGEKGEALAPVVPSRRKSAFTAVNTQDKAVSNGDVLANWDEVITNRGNDFDKITGKFTCRVPGTYAFMFSCNKFTGVNGPVCRLTKNDFNNGVVVGVFVGHVNQFHQTTNGATLDLVAGDQVWVAIAHHGGTLGSNVHKYVSFSGYLLFEDSCRDRKLTKIIMAVFSFLCITSVFYVIFNGSIVSSATMNTEPLENQSPTACSTCCQNGIHGIPGQHGLPGSKGDPGVKGQKGESGEIIAASGPAGPKGSMGWPGKSGPKGAVGPVGPEGLRGSVGQKGAKGEVPDVPVVPPRQKSAFTAVNTQDKAVSDGDVLANWDEVITNKGNDFDKNTGKFTCRVPGTYAFMFSCLKWSGVDGPVCRLTKNGGAVVGVYVGTADQFHQTTNGATLDLVTGDKVWIAIAHHDGTINSNGHRYVSFSGYLLFED
ncbi:complement C1q tumor necrosis factor-related protein 4-like [Amphiura filiformis]|uniref:complement C1q tumor necrosis factor-related protein 4-like n=1 Tax=Amphiura filiformis TaxID=82378 RepID=UPI003B21DA79